MPAATKLEYNGGSDSNSVRVYGEAPCTCTSSHRAGADWYPGHSHGLHQCIQYRESAKSTQVTDACILYKYVASGVERMQLYVVICENKNDSSSHSQKFVLQN